MLLLNSLISRQWFDLRLILSYTLTDIASRGLIYVWYCPTL